MSRPPRHLADLELAERRRAVADLGEREFRADQLSRHYFGRHTDSPDDMTDLPALVASVIDSLSPHEGAVRSKDGRWYSLRIRPYVTLDNKIDGASIVLVDIDALRRAPDTPGGPVGPEGR